MIACSLRSQGLALAIFVGYTFAFLLRNNPVRAFGAGIKVSPHSPRPPVNLKANLLSHFRSGLMGGTLAVLLGLCFWLFPFGQGLDYLSYDLPSVFNTRFVSDEVLLLQMDDASSTQLKLSPGAISFRPLHARLLDRLKADGCKMVVFDVFMKGPGAEEGDKELVRAFQNHDRVVLAADRTPVEHPQIRSYAIVPPWSNFVAVATNWGVAAVEPDTDGVIRRHYPGTDQDPSLPWAAAALAGAPIAKNAAVRLEERWLRYYGQKGTIRSLSYHMAFDQAPGYFRGKVVFIGALDKVDEFPTPYTRWDGQSTPGVEILATMFLNLIHEDWLMRLSAGRELLLVVMAGLVFGFGLNLVRPLVGAAWALLGMFVVTAVAFWLFWYWKIWFSWMVIAGLQIPGAWLCAVVAYTMRTDREKEELEVKLSTRAGAVRPVVAEPLAQRPQTSAVIPDHELLRCVGRGAYGEVWLARSIIGNYHIVKIMYQADFSTADSYAREFKGIQKYMPISLKHPGLVHILHIGRNDEGGYYYCIMEAGDDEDAGPGIDPETYSPRTLAKDLRKRRKIPVDECVSLTLVLTEALQFLHEQKLIHRDIKPSNIIFVNGIPKLADIGLVTDILGPGKEMSRVGTDGYIAPEGPGTAASDIYSLGKVMYEASMGRDRLQFPELPTSLADRTNSTALLRLNAIILKACEEDVRQRYQSAAELQGDLLEMQRRFFSPRKM